MNKALAVAGVMLRLLRDHPPVAAAAASVAAMALAVFGFHVSADQVLAVGGPVVVAANTIVWFLVSPTSKLDQRGIAPKGSDSAVGGSKPVRDSSQGDEAPGSPAAGSGG